MTITITRIVLHSQSETTIDPVSGESITQSFTIAETGVDYEINGEVVSMDVTHSPFTDENVRLGLANVAYNLERGLTEEECHAAAAEVNLKVMGL